MSNLSVNNENKKEFKSFIELLSSEICKEILNNDLKKFNTDMQNNQTVFAKNNNTLFEDIQALGTHIATVQNLSNAIKAYENEIKSNNQTVEKAYSYVKNVEQQLITNIEKKYTELYKTLQNECSHINSDLKNVYLELTKKYLENLKSEQLNFNKVLKDDFASCVKNEFPKQKLQDIDESIKKNYKEIQALANKINTLDSTYCTRYNDILYKFSDAERSIEAVSKKQSKFFTVLLIMNLLGCMAIGYLIYINLL